MQLKAVSCGELVDTTISADRKMKTFKYNLTVPTSAPNIGLAIGPFDIHVDRAMPEMTHFCLHSLQKELKAWIFTDLSSKRKLQMMSDLTVGLNFGPCIPH